MNPSVDYQVAQKSTSFDEYSQRDVTTVLNTRSLASGKLRYSSLTKLTNADCVVFSTRRSLIPASIFGTPGNKNGMTARSLNKNISELTIPSEMDGADSRSNGGENESMVMRFSVNSHALPRVLLDVDPRFEDVTVSLNEVLRQQQGKSLWASHPMFFSQEIDGVFLRIGGYDVAVIAVYVVLLGGQSQMSVDLELLN